MTASSQLITTGDAGHGTAEHSPVGGLAHDSRGGISNPILGMLLFICSEVMFFSGLFAAYFSVRAASIHWPPVPPQVPEALAERFNLHAEPWFAGALTVILITSSFTCQFGVWAIRDTRSRSTTRPPVSPTTAGAASAIRSSGCCCSSARR